MAVGPVLPVATRPRGKFARSLENKLKFPRPRSLGSRCFAPRSRRRPGDFANVEPVPRLPIVEVTTILPGMALSGMDVTTPRAGDASALRADDGRLAPPRLRFGHIDEPHAT
jgi:hypothetical protein